MTDDIPGEWRVVCGSCGWDGGTYCYQTDEHARPNYCPRCGEPIEPIEASDEPTSLSWSRDD
jgi:hypothetical protein